MKRRTLSHLNPTSTHHCDPVDAHNSPKIAANISALKIEESRDQSQLAELLASDTSKSHNKTRQQLYADGFLGSVIIEDRESAPATARSEYTTYPSVGTRSGRIVL
jgi:hypothetical protein